jgi:hypothetical protein
VGDGSAPVDMVLVEFPGNDFNGEIFAELERLVDAKTITVLDALFVRKDADGSVRWIEADEAEDTRLSRLVGAPAGLFAEEDVEAVAADLDLDSSMAMLLFEHTWAAELARGVRRANGRVIDWARVPASAISELRDAVGEE